MKAGPTTEERRQYMYRGSQISPGVYVSARDAGNFLAGAAARITGQSKINFMLNAGGFQLSKNSKAGLVFRNEYWKNKAFEAGWPAYGEAATSNFFQRLGYENIRTLPNMQQNEVRIWDRKLK